jgi:hypothetical protein
VSSAGVSIACRAVYDIRPSSSSSLNSHLEDPPLVAMMGETPRSPVGSLIGGPEDAPRCE